MMNKNFTKLTGVLLFAVGGLSTVQAQYKKIGDNPFTLDRSAVLEIESSTINRGFLPPRLTDAQQTTLGATNKAATGLMIYNTDKNGIMVNTGTPAAPVWKAAATSTLITYKSVADNYPVTVDDYTVLADVSTKDITVTLPTPTVALTGKIFVVGRLKNGTTSPFVADNNKVVTFAPAIKTSKTDSFTALNYAKTFRVQCDGTGWYEID